MYPLHRCLMEQQLKQLPFKLSHIHFNDFCLAVYLISFYTELCHNSLSVLLSQFCRTHFTSNGYQSCYYQSGTFNSGPNIDIVRPNPDTWFHMRITVSGSRASVYLNGALLTDAQVNQHPQRARAGVIVANGSKNVVYFRKLHVFTL